MSHRANGLRQHAGPNAGRVKLRSSSSSRRCRFARRAWGTWPHPISRANHINGLLAWRAMSSIYAPMGILSKTLSFFGKRREIAPATERRADLEDRVHGTEIVEARNEQAIGKEMDLS